MNKNVKLMIILLVVIIFLAGCEKRIVSDQEVVLKTKDNFKISASIWFSKGNNAVILVHMLDHDRSDWIPFAEKLKTVGISSIGIDLRGNGESEGDWKKFSDSDFNGMVNDVEAAKIELEKGGKNVIGIIGASIGANAALKFAAKDNGIKAIVLLSPGIDYKGIDISSDINTFNTPTFIAFSKEDSYSNESSHIIYEKISGKKELFIGEGLGHGTDMILKSEDMQDKILSFLAENLK